jgi:DeoR family transcriptional regulator of aga operon
MLAAERQKAILNLVHEQSVVYVADLSRRFNTSPSTIRRDLARLAAEGELQRTYGGAVALEASSRLVRKVDDTARRIGQAAASLILPGETVFIGPGLLCRVTAQHLCDRGDLTIITNSLDVAWTLYRDSTVQLILTGGSVIRPGGAMVGQVVQQAMDRIRADRLVLEVAGVSPLGGLTVDQIPQADVLRTLLESVRQITALVADERLGRAGTAWLGPVTDADVIITGRDASAAIAWDLSESGVKVTLV